ncbi:GFA family protein [Candidatus Kaiserbacteria bacterium]|nr:GFA family protein [Candidatus Kaiserbacteria bacterium]
MDKTLTGRCMCGAVQYEVNPPFTGVISCHCKDCQRLHGNYNPLLIAEKENFKFTKGEDDVEWYNSSESSERGFCKTCGSQMFKRDKTGPKIKISAGNIDDTSGLQNVKNVWTKEAGGFYTIPPGEQT